MPLHDSCNFRWGCSLLTAGKCHCYMRKGLVFDGSQSLDGWKRWVDKWVSALRCLGAVNLKGSFCKQQGMSVLFIAMVLEFTYTSNGKSGQGNFVRRQSTSSHTEAFNSKWSTFKSLSWSPGLSRNSDLTCIPNILRGYLKNTTLQVIPCILEGSVFSLSDKCERCQICSSGDWISLPRR